MKKLFPFLLVSLVLISCSTEENIQNEQKALLKSYKVVKDAQGKYSIEYSTNESVVSEFMKNVETNTNEVYLFDDLRASKDKYQEDISLENDELKVGFIENNIQRSSLLIEDDNIVLAKGAKNPSKFLKEYSIESVGNSQYQLNFKVGNNIGVYFLYDEEEKVHKIHLKEESVRLKKKEFSRVFTKGIEPLEISFVNFHQDLKRSPSPVSSSARRFNIEKDKPKLIIVD